MRVLGGGWGLLEGRKEIKGLGGEKRGWGRGDHTRSARLSSSCPMRLDLCRQRATFPSMKSKNSPKGMKARALYRGVKLPGELRQ